MVTLVQLRRVHPIQYDVNRNKIVQPNGNANLKSVHITIFLWCTYMEYNRLKYVHISCRILSTASSRHLEMDAQIINHNNIEWWYNR